VEHSFEKLLRVLFDGDVHLQFEGERSAVGVIRVRIVLGRSLRKPSSLAPLVDLAKDLDETKPLGFEFGCQPLHCG